jgi:streptogramin lyase
MPSSVAIDGSGVAWVTNSTMSGSIIGFSDNSTYGPIGSLNTPSGIAIDRSGSIWIADTGDDSITKIIGAASPVSIPLATLVGP